MVPSPCASEIVAFVAALKFTVNVSFGSSSVSPITGTVIGCVTVPGANVRTPVAAV